MNAKLFWRGLAVLALAVGLAAPGQALVVIEVEPNDTLATAQFIDTEDTAIEVQGTRTFEDPSDDFFSWLVEHPGPLRIVSSSPDAFADSIMGLYGPGGGLLASNDDGGAGSFMSVIELLVSPSMTGLYTLGFSGFNPGLLACAGGVTECYDTDDDFLFDRFVAGGGAGGSTGWDYTLVVSLASVPEPSTSLLFAVSLALLLAFGRASARTGGFVSSNGPPVHALAARVHGRLADACLHHPVASPLDASGLRRLLKGPVRMIKTIAGCAAVAAAALLASGCTTMDHQAGGGMAKQVIASKAAPEAIGPYSQAIRYGSMLFLSGQIPIDPKTNQLMKDASIEDQTRLVLDNLKAVLEANGMTMANVVSTSVFMKDLNDFSKMNAVYATYFKEAPPARATVEVARLPRDVKVEITAIAVR